MANLSITTSQVVLNSGPFDEYALAGEAITAGQAVYKKQSDGKWYLAQCDGTQEEAGQYGLGIAVNSAPGVGQAIRVALPGADVTLGAGAAPAAGTVYVVSATYGAIAPTADVTSSTNFRSLLALGKGSNKVRVVGLAAEAAIP